MSCASFVSSAESREKVVISAQNQVTLPWTGRDAPVQIDSFTLAISWHFNQFQFAFRKWFDSGIYEACWARAELFDEVIVSSRMISHHLPDTMLTALQQLDERDYMISHIMKKNPDALPEWRTRKPVPKCLSAIHCGRKVGFSAIFTLNKCSFVWWSAAQFDEE